MELMRVVSRTTTGTRCILTWNRRLKSSRMLMRNKKEKSSEELSVTIKMKSNTESKLINFRGSSELGKVTRKMQIKQTQPCRKG
jgi:hypothetical protein